MNTVNIVGFEIYGLSKCSENVNDPGYSYNLLVYSLSEYVYINFIPFSFSFLC